MININMGGQPPQQINLEQMHTMRQQLCRWCEHRNQTMDVCSRHKKLITIYNKKPNNHCPIGRWQ
jgi:hypothetical protein